MGPTCISTPVLGGLSGSRGALGGQDFNQNMFRQTEKAWLGLGSNWIKHFSLESTTPNQNLWSLSGIGEPLIQSVISSECPENAFVASCSHQIIFMKILELHVAWRITYVLFLTFQKLHRTTFCNGWNESHHCEGAGQVGSAPVITRIQDVPPKCSGLRETEPILG